jgi:hypothetical protein
MDYVQHIMLEIMTKNKTLRFGTGSFYILRLKVQLNLLSWAWQINLFHLVDPNVQMDKFHCVDNPKCDAPRSEFCT